LASKLDTMQQTSKSKLLLSVCSNATADLDVVSRSPFACRADLISKADPVVVTGISIGLPNELRGDCRVFDVRNLDRIFGGENFISQLTPAQKQRILNQNIVQVLKVDGQRVKRKLSKPTEVISLASRLGHFDLVKEYGVPPHVVETLDITYQLAIAAGLEACVNAGIPVLARSECKDSPGSVVAKVHPLPESMQAETGVIFASSFPCLDSCVQEISLCSAHHTRQFLSECGHLRDSLTQSKSDQEYEFDRKLLFKLLVMANNQLAELIRARGPNTHVNAACASTSQAIAIAHDWLKVGRCRRVIVISADNATNDNLLPYLGTGFLALTAASTAPTVETGALPFDKRRNGIVLGMGAAGLVLELSSCAIARKARPIVELVGSHFLNSAFHGSLLDREHISTELLNFINKLEAETGMSRPELAQNLIYYSHETQTSAQGGCAKAEIDALSLAFGEQSKPHILIANTKGFTGHPMGVGLEDVVAVASLDRGVCPPIANFKEQDPCLGDIMLAQGGLHGRKYALRFSAGFGSQFVFLLFKKWEDSPAVSGAPRSLRTSCNLPLSTDSTDSDVESSCDRNGERDDDLAHHFLSDVNWSKSSMSSFACMRNHYAGPMGRPPVLSPEDLRGADDVMKPSVNRSPRRSVSPTVSFASSRSARTVPADVQDSCVLM